MLYDKLSVVKDNKYIKLINTFLYSPYYMMLVTLLMVASNIFAIEFAVIYIYAAFILYVSFFAPDIYPIMPITCCSYMLFSRNNNPVRSLEETFLSESSNKIEFVLIICVVAAVLLPRIIYEISAKKRYKDGVPKLTFGFLALGVSYIISGIFSPEYSLRTAFFGFVETVCLCATYYVFYLAVDFSKRSETDFALMFSIIGLGIVLEIVGMYIAPEVVETIKNGEMKRWDLYTGWGVYNNIGGMMAMMIPAPFYLALKHKYRGFWFLAATLFMVATVFTQSRGSILAGGGVFVLCIIFTFVFGKGKERIYNGIWLGSIFVGVAVLCAVIFRDRILQLFSYFPTSDFFDSDVRWEGYAYGIQCFKEFPIFGNGFYVGEGVLRPISENAQNSRFLPPMFHNTLIQLLACGGVVSLAAYVYHRVQTICLVLKRPTAFKTFMAFSILALLLGTLVDCNFFNLGPGLFYGIMLLSMDKTDKNNS